MLAACRKNDVETAKLLIDAGADVTKTDKVILLVLKYACNLEVQFGTFPLLAACETGALECVKLLIDAGVNIAKANKVQNRKSFF